MAPRFAFLHVGDDIAAPAILVRSIRKFHPDAVVIQCGDRASPKVAGVDQVSRIDGDTSKLMMFRLASFAALAGTGPTLFLDTDMIVVRQLDLAAMLAGCEVAVCRREFDVNLRMATSLRGLDFSEHAGRTLGQVYPYIACTTVATGNGFWLACVVALERLNEKFHRWYGDQEAIRDVVESGRFKVRALPESIYGCLPNRKQKSSSPRILHFKGPALKDTMLTVAARWGI